MCLRSSFQNGMSMVAAGSAKPFTSETGSGWRRKITQPHRCLERRILGSFCQNESERYSNIFLFSSLDFPTQSFVFLLYSRVMRRPVDARHLMRELQTCGVIVAAGQQIRHAERIRTRSICASATSCASSAISGSLDFPANSRASVSTCSASTGLEVTDKLNP